MKRISLSAAQSGEISSWWRRGRVELPVQEKQPIPALPQLLFRYAREFPTATETLAKHLEECLAFYCFPERHWKHILTSNVIEGTFKEVKRMTNVVGRFPTETSALMMVFGVLDRERLKWQKVRMKADDITWIEEAAKSLEQEPIKLQFLEEMSVA